MLAYKFSGKIIRFYVVCIGWFFMIADICANLNFRCDVIYEYRHMFLTGAVATVVITVIATLFGTILGTIGALMRIMRFENGNVFMRAFAWLCRTISWLYITFFRGTPMYVQIFIWYFVWFVALVHPQHGLIVSGAEAVALRREYGAWIAGCLALTANTGAYITEIFRAGIAPYAAAAGKRIYHAAERQLATGDDCRARVGVCAKNHFGAVFHLRRTAVHRGIGVFGDDDLLIHVLLLAGKTV